MDIWWSVDMTDESDLDTVRNTTIPSPAEHDTGRYRDEAALARAYVAACNARDEFEKWVSYLEGKLNGVEVDVAQSQAFEKRTESRLATIEAQNAKLIEQNETIIAMLSKLSDDMLNEASKVVRLRESERRANVARCDDCPIREVL